MLLHRHALRPVQLVAAAHLRRIVAVATQRRSFASMIDDPPMSEKIALNKAIIDSFNTGPDDPAVTTCVADHYYQHNLMVPDGKAGYANTVGHIFKASKAGELPPLSSKVVRTFGDTTDPTSHYTFFHVQYEFFGPKVGFDVCRWEDGKIVEHWDNLQSVESEEAGSSMLAGPTEATDSLNMEKTISNKNLVRDFTFNVLTAGRLDQLDKYVADDLIQHDPTMANGKAALTEKLKKLADAKLTYYQSYKKILVGDGDFVLATGEQYIDPADKSSGMAAHWDLYRVADGKIAEHWNIIEPLLPEEKHAHPNGKW